MLRDDFGPDSDIDVLVEFEPETRIGLITYIEAMQELSDLLQHPVDLVLREGLKPLEREGERGAVQPAGAGRGGIE